MTALSVALLRTDGGTQPRVELREDVIAEYAEDLRNGATFPPVVVFYDGADYWLSDGFHRLHAAIRANQTTIEAEVRPGTLAEAQWYSYSVNQAHGLRRSNEDKRRAVEAALRHEFAGRHGIRGISRHCGVSEGFVHKLWHDASVHGEQMESPRVVTRGGTTFPMQTANIGRRNGHEPAEVAKPAEVAAEPRPVAAAPAAPQAEPEPAARQAEPPAPPRSPQETRLFRFDPPPPPRESATQIRLVQIRQVDARQPGPLPPVDLVITSPPYNVGIEYASHDDALSEADYRGLLLAVFGHCYRALVDGGRMAVVVPFGVGRKPWQPVAARVADWLVETGLTLRGQIVWDKGTTGNRTSWGSFRLPTDPALRDTTEAILIAHKGASRLALPAGVTLHDEKGSYTAWLANADEFMTLAQDHWTLAPESSQRIGHPAPFPVALAERLIRFYGYPGCHVLDPFAGSGTVGVAAVRLGCRATLCEIDAGYCDLAARRCQEACDAQS